jgi:hypothetical protein
VAAAADVAVAGTPVATVGVPGVQAANSAASTKLIGNHWLTFMKEPPRKCVQRQELIVSTQAAFSHHDAGADKEPNGPR